MKTEFEPEDIRTITERVVEMLKPHLLRSRREERDDIVLDMAGLCDYLKVTPKWVYEQTHLKAIPYMKLGNKQLRFRKRKIDEWLDTLGTPAIAEPDRKLRLLK